VRKKEAFFSPVLYGPINLGYHPQNSQLSEGRLHAQLNSIANPFADQQGGLQAIGNFFKPPDSMTALKGFIILVASLKHKRTQENFFPLPLLCH
jgi:hypothetical protein